MNENIITIESATKQFKERVVFHDVSVTFEKGKTHGIIGRNGSGKTVLFKCICGFMPLTTGTISVHGQVIGKDLDIPKDIGIIIEAPGFLPQYSGYKNLMLLASIRRKHWTNTLNIIDLEFEPKRSTFSMFSLIEDQILLARKTNQYMKEQITEVMQLVGLDPNNKVSVGQYSLGMRQRLGIAQAIMEKPSILIMDEPTNGLDNRGVEDVRRILSDLSSNGTTILMASHNADDIRLLCDVVYEMDNGQLTIKGS